MCDSAQSLLALSEQSALCTFFSILPPGLAALLRSAGFFSGAAFFIRLMRATKRFSWFSDCITKVQKCVKTHKCISVNLVDLRLVKIFQTSFLLLLQNLASIQPRTGLSKFAND